MSQVPAIPAAISAAKQRHSFYGWQSNGAVPLSRQPSQRNSTPGNALLLSNVPAPAPPSKRTSLAAFATSQSASTSPLANRRNILFAANLLIRARFDHTFRGTQHISADDAADSVTPASVPVHPTGGAPSGPVPTAS